MRKNFIVGAIRYGKRLDTKNRQALMKMEIGQKEVGDKNELVSDKSCMDWRRRADLLRLELHSIQA